MDELETIGLPESRIDKKFEAKLFQDLGSIEDIDDYLKDTMGMDIRHYFLTPIGREGDEQRAQIKGAYSRTKYFRTLILRERKMLEMKKEKKVA